MPPTSETAQHVQYPINLELAGRAVLVVGGGNVARHKIQAMISAGANVTVVAPSIHEEIRARATVLALHPRIGEATLTLVERAYEPNDLDGVWLTLTCTDDPDVNRQVHADAELRRVWSNSADDPANCAWTLPSVARQGDLQLTISTRGRSPALSMWLRKRFERQFDGRWADLLDVLSEVRSEARSTFGTSEVRGWLDGLDDGVFDLVMAGDLVKARHLLRRSIGLADAEPARQLRETIGATR